MAEIITDTDIPADLRSKVDEYQLALMLAGLNARAIRVAPCLGATGVDSPTGDQLDEARLVLLSALTRWITDGTTAVGSTVTQGPFVKATTPQQPTRVSGYRLWPTEIADLQAICKTGGGITSIEMVSSQGTRCGTNPDTFDAGPPA